jgi:Zn-dependent protease with chaperone function
MLIQGKWYSDGSAAQYNAALHVTKGMITITIAKDEEPSFSSPIDQIRISDRLGNIERKLHFADGSIFTTRDNDSVDTLLTGGHIFTGHIFTEHSPFNRLLHQIESNMAWVVTAVVVTILSCILFFTWGVPWISAQIAHALPQKTNTLIASNTLAFLDDYIFQASELPTERMEKIRDHFTTTLIPLDDKNKNIPYQLHFRKWTQKDVDIPNAFALPSGDIILTDKFVTLSHNQQEIDAVLLHEMGHIVHRHTLKRVIEATFVTTVVMMVTGDTNGLADMGIGVGSLLLSANYSREYESEADTYAFEKMLRVNIDPQAFSDIMGRMEYFMMAEKEKNTAGNNTVANNTPEATPQEQNPNKPQTDTLLDYFSSHPSTQKRIKQAERYSLCFQQGLLICSTNKQ